MLKENLAKVNKKWHEECLKLAEPLCEKEVIRKFAAKGISLSQDAVEVFSSIGGFAEDDMDSECLTFWTVERILEDEWLNFEEIYFADFLIDSHHYYFKSKNSEVSEIYVSYSETDRCKIADSFDDFFELYLKDIIRLFV